MLVRMTSLIGAAWLAACAWVAAAPAARAGAATGNVAEPAPNAGIAPKIAAETAWPGRPGRYVFEVTRDGTRIGSQSIEIRRAGNAVTAVTESQVAVKMLGIVVYRMHQVMTETFVGRRLQSVRTETKDGGGLRVAALTREGVDHWSGSLDKTPRAFDCDCQASAMWHVSSIDGNEIIEASQARPRRITVTDLGLEDLDLPEGQAKVRHFAVKGEIEREVWYDEAGNLVAARQIGSDGSLIREKLIADPDSPEDAENRPRLPIGQESTPIKQGLPASL
jgi:hypothetical protein